MAHTKAKFLLREMRLKAIIALHANRPVHGTFNLCQVRAILLNGGFGRTFRFGPQLRMREVGGDV